jgi:release factor glutamine methyltransferase
MPTVKALLAEAAVHDIERLDIRLLLQHAASLSHSDIISDPGRIVDDAAAQSFRRLINLRLEGAPVSRLLGEREFYGRVFKISPAVLDPRADSETLIDAALTLQRPKRILDLGTGSGILALTLLAEMPDATAVAVDLSLDALDAARINAKALGVDHRVTFLRSNWFEAVEGVFDLIVSNPPYIPSHEIPDLQIEVRAHDPHLALDGGADGLQPYRFISDSVARYMSTSSHVLVEIGAGQESDVTSIFAAQGFVAHGQWRDLGGHVRVLAFNKP